MSEMLENHESSENLELNQELGQELVQMLLDYCDEYAIQISSEQAELCVKHLLLVIEKNKVLNLTRILNPKDAVVLHLLDSLLLLPYLQKAPAGDYLDMGTGAGFPGIELGICSGRNGLLIDSVGKKVDAVCEFADELDLQNIAAEQYRLEEAALDFDEQFTCVVARALAPLPVLIEYATPFLEEHGRFVVTKGNPEKSELASGKKAAKLCGFKLIESQSFELPNDLGHRELYVFEKVSKAKVKLPRANGMARKKPLA